MHSACYAKPDPYSKKWSETVSLDLRMYFAPQRSAFFRHRNLSSGLNMWWFFFLHACCMLTSKCAWRIFAPQRRALFRHPHLQKCSERSRHSSAHFLNISTFKNAPNMKCFWRFDFKMSFAPQQRAIFDLSSHHMAPRPPR